MNYVQDSYRWDQRGILFKPSTNADEAELNAIKRGITPIDIGVVDDIIADEHHSDLPEHGYTWKDEESALDMITGPVIQEIDRRIKLGGSSYPFIREGNALKYIRSKTLAYEFCLITTIQKNISSAPFNQLPILFELLVTEVAKCYLGGTAEGIRTGAPSHDPVERPKNFKKLFEKVNELTLGEFQWLPTVHLEDDESPSAPKDEGLDFIAWKPFGDFRNGQLFILGQCACGDDWETKFSDLQAEKLERWINPVTYAKFLRAFSVPHHIPGHAIFNDVCRRAGITFDRLRISKISEENYDHFESKFGSKMQDAIGLVVKPYQ
jgi:hypothetical protein